MSDLVSCIEGASRLESMAESYRVGRGVLATAVRIVSAPKLVREHAREGGEMAEKTMCSDTTGSVRETRTACS